MEEKKEDFLGFFVDIALIFGIIYLASQNKDGWGWLTFILFIKHS